MTTLTYFRFVRHGSITLWKTLGNIILRLNPESNAEYNPEYKYHDHRIDKRPYKAQQRADILGCHFPFGHGNNQMFLQEYQSNEVKKAFYHFSLLVTQVFRLKTEG